ncbi:MAG: L,D-transpeptidase family protein [Atopobiaceae bacterium]
MAGDQTDPRDTGELDSTEVLGEAQGASDSSTEETNGWVREGDSAQAADDSEEWSDDLGDTSDLAAVMALEDTSELPRIDEEADATAALPAEEPDGAEGASPQPTVQQSDGVASDDAAKKDNIVKKSEANEKAVAADVTEPQPADEVHEAGAAADATVVLGSDDRRALADQEQKVSDAQPEPATESVPQEDFSEWFSREEPADGGQGDEGEDEPTTELEIPDAGNTDEVVSAASLQHEEHHHKVVRRRIVLGVVAAAVVCCYVGGAAYFGSHFYPHTSVNGIDASLRTTDQLADEATQDASSFQTQVSMGDFSLDVQAADVSYACDGSAVAADARSQESALSWPVALFQDHVLTTDSHTSYDDAQLTQLVNQAVQQHDATSMVTSYAYVGYNYDSQQYEVMGKVSGTALDAHAVHDALAQAIQAVSQTATLDASASHDATLDDCLQLKQVADTANTVRGASIDITLNGQTCWTLDDTLKSWVTVSKSQLVVNQQAVRVWAKYTLAPQIAYSDDENDYTLDVDTFVNTLVEHLQQGNVDPIEAPMTQTKSTEGLSKEAAYAKGGWDSSKGRYVDVDLDAQYARMYDQDGTVLWESAIVSGNASEGRSTPTGTYYIDSYMTQDTTLIGADEDLDGDPDYQSHVDYWMPFIGNAYAFHDASWRSNFGGKIYQTNGSHGCVNLPHQKAQDLYGIVQVGDQVYIHT